MLSKTERLSRTKFATYFKTGRRFNNDHLQVVYTPFPTLHCSVVVGKKVFKSAVKRNQLRRQIYAQLRTQLHGKATGVYIVLVKPTMQKQTKNTAKEQVTTTLEKISQSI